MAQSAENSRGSADGFVERRTRHQFPDETQVNVHLRLTTEGALVSDLGATLARFRAAAGQRLPRRVRLTIEGICRMNDLVLDRGIIYVQVAPGGDVAEAVDRLGRVRARVAKLRACEEK